MTPRPIATLVVAGLAFTPPSGLSAQHPLCEKAGNAVTEMGVRSEEGRNLVTESRELDTFVKSRYIRARLRAQGGSGDWRLVVRDPAGHPLDTFGPGDFKVAADRWTRRIPGGYALFDIFPAADNTLPPAITLVEYIAVDASAERPYYSYQNAAAPQLFDLYGEKTTPNERRMGDHVGFVVVGFGTIVWTCSGVLVAADILLTNWHCGGFAKLQEASFWDPQICAGMLIDFSWDDDEASVDFGCSKVLLTDKARDLAFIRIHPLAGASPPRPARLGRRLPSDRAVRLVHHPEARRKVVSRCRVEEEARDGWTGEPQVDFSHRCDSEGGSSGGPIFDGSGMVVGLHHHGFAIDVKTCQSSDDLNKAVRIEKIIERLEEWSKGTDDRAATARAIRERLSIE